MLTDNTVPPSLCQSKLMLPTLRAYRIADNLKRQGAALVLSQLHSVSWEVPKTYNGSKNLPDIASELVSKHMLAMLVR